MMPPTSPTSTVPPATLLSSPPISPLTYNASTDEDTLYAWSNNLTQSIEEHPNNDNDAAANHLPRHRIASEDLHHIICTEKTPKAGVASSHRRQHSITAPSPSSNNNNISSLDTKTPKASNKKMSDVSVQGVLAGERNIVDTMRGDEDDTTVSRLSLTSVSTFTSVWRRLYRRNNANDDVEHTQVKRNETAGTSGDEEDMRSLRELEENDAFALEVGLMFSADDGDTIANADIYSQGLPNILTMDSFDAATIHDQDSHTKSHRNRHARNSSFSDLSAYLHSHRHNTNISSNLSLEPEGHDDNGGGYIQNPMYAVGIDNSNHRIVDGNAQNSSFCDDDHDEQASAADTNTTIRDDHGNRLPPNARSILRFKKANNTSGCISVNNSTFPNSHPPPPSHSHQYQSKEEMEKRLRDLAGQLNHEWRSGSTTFIASPALARRLRDFQFAREKRRKKYGIMKPWGILGLYEHLSGVKIDVEWAEDAAWRRTNDKPYLTWGDFEVLKSTGKNRPFFTYFVVSMCTAMMFAAWFVNGWHFEPLSVNPMIGPSAETLIRLGAKDSYLIVYEQEIWRLVSPMVVHAGLIHYILNMFALWYVGKAIELIHGHFQAASTFVVPAIGGIILSAIFLPEYITVGASGGIFGLIGACISDIVMNWNLLFNQFVNERSSRMSHARVLIGLLLDIIINCLLGLTPFVDNFTHLGGMIYGFLCGLSTMKLVSLRFFGEKKQCGHNAKLFFFRFFGLLVSMAGIIASSIVLFSGDGKTNPCPSCNVMSCIPFPPWNGPNEKWWYCDDCAQATAEGTLNTATGKFIEMDLTCPDRSIVYVKVDESWPQDELGLETMLPALCRERCF